MKLSKFCASIAMVIAASTLASSANAADTAKRLSGGGSNIMYVITPSHSNPFFKTEAEVAAKTAKDLGYTVKMVSHDDSPVKQSDYSKLLFLIKQLQLSVITQVQMLLFLL